MALDFGLETIPVKIGEAEFEILSNKSLPLKRVAAVRRWGAKLQNLEELEDSDEAYDRLVTDLAELIVVELTPAKLAAIQTLGVGQLTEMIQAVFQQAPATAAKPKRKPSRR